MTYELQPYEVAFPVIEYFPKRKIADYRNSPEAEVAFRKAEADVKRAKKMFIEEANAAGIHVDSISLIEFLEFDSPNGYHAMAYFDVRYFGDPMPEEA